MAVKDRVLRLVSPPPRGASHTAIDVFLRSLAADQAARAIAVILSGLETCAIATQLGLSVKTIETYHARIKKKLGLKTAHELIRAAVSWAER